MDVSRPVFPYPHTHILTVRFQFLPICQGLLKKQLFKTPDYPKSYRKGKQILLMTKRRKKFTYVRLRVIYLETQFYKEYEGSGLGKPGKERIQIRNTGLGPGKVLRID